MKSFDVNKPGKIQLLKILDGHQGRRSIRVRNGVGQWSFAKDSARHIVERRVANHEDLSLWSVKCDRRGCCENSACSKPTQSSNMLEFISVSVS